MEIDRAIGAGASGAERSADGEGVKLSGKRVEKVGVVEADTVVGRRSN